MKKYRHKKTGIIASKISTHPRYELSDDDIGDCIIDGRLIEDSNDWEEITEPKKDYEILSFKQDSGCSDLWTYFTAHGYEGWCRNCNGRPGTAPYTTEQILNNHLTGMKYSIHSVKRLSDGSKDDA